MSEMTLRISEIFGPTVQGEGALIGKPTVFVRTGGCDYRCTWCDTLHAVESKYRDTWIPMTAADIMQEVERLSQGQPLMITISGGNPAIQNCAPLIALGHEKGYRFAMETQGSIAQDWFADLDHLIVSPKPPSSGMVCDLDALNTCIKYAGKGADIIVKIVIKDDADYAFSKTIHAAYPHLPFYLQPCNTDTDGEGVDQGALRNAYEDLITRTLKDGWFDVTVLPQLHVWVWGNKQGV